MQTRFTSPPHWHGHDCLALRRGPLHSFLPRRDDGHVSHTNLLPPLPLPRRSGAVEGSLYGFAATLAAADAATAAAAATAEGAAAGSMPRARRTETEQGRDWGLSKAVAGVAHDSPPDRLGTPAVDPAVDPAAAAAGTVAALLPAAERTRSATEAYATAAQGGQGLAAVLQCALRIVTKASHPPLGRRRIQLSVCMDAGGRNKA